MKNKIIDYLGIEREFANERVNKLAINEAMSVEEKYERQLKRGVYHYAFHEDVFRCYNNGNEYIVVVEKLEHITVFEIKKQGCTKGGEKGDESDW